MGTTETTVCSKIPSFPLSINKLLTKDISRLQFDEFQIVSSSHDDTILIWDFLNCSTPERCSSTPPSL
jgi:hypothetical protein